MSFDWLLKVDFIVNLWPFLDSKMYAIADRSRSLNLENKT